ncbi:sialate O-acetylesterase [Sphingobacterium faecium NBRC 15299]|nr:sialate O-acetylesterase [Sphingobacterium faecium NBRC 15299]
MVYPQKKVACIGDSITKGLGIKNGNKTYPERLQELLGSNYDVQNFGFSGATLLRKGHKPYVETTEYRQALAFQPDIAVIALGINDTDPRNWPNYGDEFEQDYGLLIGDLIKTNPHIAIYICTLTPIFSGHPRFLSGTRDWYQEISLLIPKIAKNNQVKLIDINGQLKSRIDLFEDNIHPNAVGATLIAKQVHRALTGVKQPLSVDLNFGDHMVLQRNRENQIAGKASSHERVTLHFNHKVYQGEANENGHWSIRLPSMPAGGPYEIVIRSEDEEVKLKDVLFGDVYLASGQSNMAFELKHALASDSLIQIKAPHIRLFKSANLVQTNSTTWDLTTLEKINNLDFFSGKWSLPTKGNKADFSAVAYAFAIEIASKTNIPIGIVELDVPGSNTESWIDRTTLEQDNLLATYIHNWRKSDFIQDFCRTRSDQNLALATQKYQRHPYDPSFNFEAGVVHWLKTQFTAILWYQGESNAHNIELHELLFKTLVSSWRHQLQQQLPFYYVQLSSINLPSWPRFRDSQRKLNQQTEDTYMAISSDVGDPLDVHPKNKVIIGKRLANLALAHTYKYQINADYPSFKYHKKKEKTIDVYFNNTKTLTTRNNQPLQGFILIDKKGFTHQPARLSIQKNRVTIHLPEHIIITEIRYAYSPYTTANLENESGVPASTFSFKID